MIVNHEGSGILTRAGLRLDGKYQFFAIDKARTLYRHIEKLYYLQWSSYNVWMVGVLNTNRNDFTLVSNLKHKTLFPIFLTIYIDVTITLPFCRYPRIGIAVNPSFTIRIVIPNVLKTVEQVG